MKYNDVIDEIKKKTEQTPIPDSLTPEQIKRTLSNKRPAKSIITMKISITMAACLLICVLAVVIWQFGGTQSNPDMRNASIYENADLTSYTQIKNALLKNSVVPKQSSIDYSTNGSGQTESTSASAIAREGSLSTESKSDTVLDSSAKKNFSQTNTQVQGIDEADIIKTDGQYIYTVNNNYSSTIHITKAKNGKLIAISEIDIPETSKLNVFALEIYLVENTLIVVCSTEDHDNNFVYQDPATNACHKTTNLIYDISDIQNPKLCSTLEQDGTYLSSRKSDDFVYTFSRHNIPYIQEDSLQRDYIPYQNDKPINCEDIYLPDEINENSYLVITAYNIMTPNDFISQKSILSASDNLYVSDKNIYASSAIFDAKKNPGKVQSQIFKIGYHDGILSKPVSGKIDGILNNQFSMDEYDSYLRVVSTVDTSGITYTEKTMKNDTVLETNNRYNALFVLNTNLKVVGSIKNLAPNESIYSARFMGDMGYFVTYRQTDPLFSADLSDPENPKIVGELKIPGFSEYLHFYSDKLLLGIGKEIDPKSGAFYGLKLSMFDITDPTNVTEDKKLVLSKYYDSPALRNHKSVLIDLNKNLFGFCVKGTNINNDYLLFSYKNGFSKNAAFHLDNIPFNEDTRAIYIGNNIYLFIPGYGIQSYSLKTNKRIDNIVFH